MKPISLNIKDLKVEINGKCILNGINLNVVPGSILGIVGPNGAGKTTLLKVVLGSLVGYEGEVFIEGQELRTIHTRNLATLCAAVLQESGWDVNFSVQEVVSMGRYPHISLFQKASKDDMQICESAMDRMDVLQLKDRKLRTLSSGEKQRTIIARAICQDAGLFVLDEPTNHLDLRHQFSIMDTLSKLGKTVIVVLHDLNLAARYCDTLCLIHDGEIIANGPAKEVMTEDALSKVYEVNVSVIHNSAIGDLHVVFYPEKEKQSC